jgi:hypothetical protein
MSTHPISLRIESPPEWARVHVLIRLVLLMALGALGCSSLYWLLYLGLPALAALLIAQKGSADYIAADAPRITPVLSWLAGVYAYLWLLTDRWPTEDARPVELTIAPESQATPGAALGRLFTSIPALLLLVLASVVACFLWMVGALWVLLTRRVPAMIVDFLTLVLTYQFRLVGYHLALVDRYPSFEPPLLTRTV